MPTLGVNAVVVEKGRVLLIKRTDIPVWALPGGGVEANESLMEAVVRETKEETGLGVRAESLEGLYSRPRWRGGGDHIAVFLCTVVEGRVRAGVAECAECQFHDPGSLPDDLWPPHREMISDALDGTSTISVRTSPDAWPYESDSWACLVEDWARSSLSPAEFLAACGIGKSSGGRVTPRSLHTPIDGGFEK